MVSYPVHVPRPMYRGQDRNKKAAHMDTLALAAKLEAAINAKVALQTRRRQSYTWDQFAREVGTSVERIAKIGYAIDGGSNGFTVYREELPENE